MLFMKKINKFKELISFFTLAFLANLSLLSNIDAMETIEFHDILTGKHFQDEIILIKYSDENLYKALINELEKAQNEKGEIATSQANALIADSIEELKKSHTYLIPLDHLNKLGLCPLFPRYEYLEIEGEKEPVRSGALDVKYRTTKTWDLKLISETDKLQNLPCFKTNRNLQEEGFNQILSNQPFERTIIQLKTINQNEAIGSTAMCGGLSLHNGILMHSYAKTGDLNYLKELTNEKLAKEFLQDNGCMRWVNSEELNKIFQNFRNIDTNNFAVIPTVFALDKRYYDYPFYFTETQRQEFDQILKKISSGLQKNNFFYTIIIGDQETAQFSKEGRGHFFNLSIFKVGNNVQYVITDTQPENYHLLGESYEYKRILHLIGLVESYNKAIETTVLDLFKDTPLAAI